MYIKIHTLTTIDILVPQRKPGAPIIHIRHMDDWIERQYRQCGGLGLLSNTPGGEWILGVGGEFWWIRWIVGLKSGTPRSLTRGANISFD